MPRYSVPVERVAGVTRPVAQPDHPKESFKRIYKTDRDLDVVGAHLVTHYEWEDPPDDVQLLDADEQLEYEEPEPEPEPDEEPPESDDEADTASAEGDEDEPEPEPDEGDDAGSGDGEGDEEDEEDEDDGDYPCDDCDQVFDSPQGLAGHSRVHKDE